MSVTVECIFKLLEKKKELQAAEFRALVSKAAIAGLNKGQDIPVHLFEQVWYPYFYGKPLEAPK